MTYGSFEPSSQEKQRIQVDRRRATQAMVNLIVLRDADQLKTPNLDPDSHEGWLRLQLFRLQHEAVQADPDGEFDVPGALSLGETMMNPHLTDLALPGRPITPHRLIEINPSLLTIVNRMDEEGIGWPDDETVFHDVLSADFDDYSFGEKLVHGGRAYNNFPAIIKSLPRRPDEGETLVSFMHRTNLFQYTSKPYLARAHALQPEFMGALQARMATLDSSSSWQESLYRSVTEEHPDPEDQILLRASRLSYQLLINLMRKDDLQIQSRMLTMSMQDDIVDPLTELWT